MMKVSIEIKVKNKKYSADIECDGGKSSSGFSTTIENKESEVAALTAALLRLRTIYNL